MNVFSLFAKIGLDTKEYENGLKESKSKFHDFADGMKGAAGKVGDVLLGIGKAAAAGIGAASTALAGLTKQSLSATADYEQLVGGVDKIFGESSKKVQEYANQAYQTAGLSANEYMKTVTGFSASLLQSLGGDIKAAAEIANRALIDMSDNANTYGTDMQSIQNAYMGFSKQNYTMLDNLKLGYGGTQAEMKRLISDASKMNKEMQALGVTVDEDSMSFGNIINAISVMQEHMNIAGTTSKEASGTISGSIESMKAAWKNFLTGTGSPDQFASSLKTAFGNIKSSIKKILPNLGRGILSLSRELLPEIPTLIEEFLPPVITVAKALITRLAAQLPGIITELIPALSQGVINTSVAIVQVLPSLITSLKDTIPIILTAIWEKKDELFEAGKEIISSLIPSDEEIEKLPKLISGAAKTITSFAVKLTNPENLNKVIDKGFEIITALIDGLTSEETLDQFFDEENGVAKVIENLVDALIHFVTKLTEAATDIIKNLGDYLNNEDNRKQIYDAAEGILTKIGEGLNSKEAREAVGGLLLECAKFIVSAIVGGVDWEASGGDIATQVVTGLWKTLSGYNLGQKFHDFAYDFYNGPVQATGTTNPRQVTTTVYPTTSEHVDQMFDYYSTRYGGKSIKRAGVESTQANNGVTIGEINVTVSGEDNVDRIGERVVQSIDEALKKYQITQNRGVGAVTW